MGFDLKAIQAQWDNPVEDSPSATGTGWDAPVGVPANKITSPSLSAVDSFNTMSSHNFSETKDFQSSNTRANAPPSFQEDRPQQANRVHDNKSRSSSIHQRDTYQQRPRDNSRDREQFSGTRNNYPRREPQDFNHSSNSSDSGRHQKRFDNNASQSRYGQGRSDYSNQPDFHQTDKRSNNGFNGGSAPRNEYNHDHKPQQFQSRGRDGSHSRASSSYQDASSVSENVEPRGRTRSAVPATGSLETSLDWMNYPKDLDIFYVMDIFGQLKGKRGILLKIKNEKVARLTFESLEFVQEAVSIFKEANQPGSIQPASDSEPPKPSINPQYANYHDSEHRSEKPSQSNRSSSRTSNHSASYQRSKPSNNPYNNFSDNSSSRRSGTSQSNWAQNESAKDNRKPSYSNTGPFSFDDPPEANGSDWNTSIESSHSSQVKNFEATPKFVQPSQTTNNWNLVDENKPTSEWDSPIDSKKAHASVEANNSLGWEAPIINKKSSYQQTPLENKPQFGCEAPIESKNNTRETSFDNKSNNWNAPVQTKSTPEWEAPKELSKSNLWQSPIEQEKPHSGFKTENDHFSKSEAPIKNNDTSLGWSEPIQAKQTTNWEAPINNNKTSATREPSITRDPRYTAYEKSSTVPDFSQDTSKHQDLRLIPEPKAPTTASITDDQKVLLHVLSPENDSPGCLAIYNYPTFSPLDDLYDCFSQSVSELAFVTPTLLYIRFKSHSHALKACQDYKVSGRQGFARVAIPPPYVNFISCEELETNLSYNLSDNSPEDKESHNIPEHDTNEKICSDEVIETIQPIVPPSCPSTPRQDEYPTPPPDPPVRQRIKPPTNTGPALRMIAHALGRRPPTNIRK